MKTPQEQSNNQSTTDSALQPNGGNPNTVAVFTAKVLQVGFQGPTMDIINNIAIISFSIIIVIGVSYNGYNFFKMYQAQLLEKNTLNQEEDLPIEQDYSTSFNNE